MRAIEFDWNGKKNKENVKKHGISFEEARTVFLDENAIEFYDATHSGKEDRFLLLGMDYKLRMVIISYTVKENKVTIIRIISARKATKSEIKEYKGE